jgi:peptidyl-prolyl cis-trans isomerase A (cyclophilin A)
VRRFTIWLCLFIFTALVPSGLLGQTQPAASKPAPAEQQKSSGAKTGASLLHPETLKAKAPDVYEVQFVTTKGNFVIQVTRAWAPLGADRFYNLVKHHFYDGASLFRVLPGFVVQFGLGPNPAVNKAWTDAKIKPDPVLQKNIRGYVTYAMSPGDTGSRTTQVFINLADNSRLDKDGFAPFGKVTEGMAVVNQFYGGYADSPTSHQHEITNEGKAYLEKNFPKLDSIKTATIISPAAAPTAPAAKGMAPAAKSTPPAAGEKPKP